MSLLAPRRSRTSKARKGPPTIGRPRGLADRLAAATPMVLVALLGAGPRSLRAQDADLPLAGPIRTTPADSADLLDDARDAQRRFESFRVRHLPETLGWGSGPCDDRVGRMCWRREPGSLWEPEPEDPEVVEARDSLLVELERVARTIPGDEWVLGQRVWYLGEAGRWDEAEALARRCGGAPGWWCAALEGLALHVEGHYPAAEAAFVRAMAAMDSAEAREWREVEPLLDGDGRHLLEEAAERSPAEREALIRRLWRLSDPLELVPGNDRRTEHLARRTVIRIRSEARNPHRIYWGSDLAELVLRYGWEVGWERLPAPMGRPLTLQSVVGHEHPDSRGYIPPGEVLADPVSAGPEPMTPSSSYRPSTYAPTYAPVVLPMTSRVVVLPRGDRSLVAATFELPADTTLRGRRGVRREHRPPPAFGGSPVQAGLFLTDVDGGRVRSVRVTGQRRGVVLQEVPAGRYWVSVEALDPEVGRAGRLRRGLPIPAIPPDVAALSDLMLLAPGPEPQTAREALRRLRVDEVVASGDSILVAWEIWGLGWRDEVLEYRLSVERGESGFFRRAGQFLGLVDPEEPTFLEWSEPGPPDPGPALRSVSMRLPELDPGMYVLRLRLTAPGRSPLVTERPLEVVPSATGGDPGRR